MSRSGISHAAVIVIPLSTVNSLHRHQVRPGTAPSARNCASVKIYQQMMTRSILQNIQIIVHHLLAVWQEEINLNSGCAHLLQTGHLLLAGLGSS